MIKPSSFWIKHFKHNLTVQRVDWLLQPNITEIEKENILYSLKAWQLGETSDGHNLIAASAKFAAKNNDPEYLEAIKLFIKEEQKHGENLGIYIDRIGEQRTKRDWGDWLFRRVRYFNTSMELWTVTVIIVESAAQIFYQALHDATNCKLLRQICTDILIDEAHHIKFQNERLFMIFRDRSFYAKAIAVTWYCLLFFITVHAVWIGHSKAFKAGGVNFSEFMRMMYCKFFKTIHFIHRPHRQEQSQRMAILR